MQKIKRFQIILISLAIPYYPGPIWAGDGLKLLEKFQRQQLNYCYQKFFRLEGLYRSSPYVFNEVDIAVTGFCLASLPIAVEKKLISAKEASNLALETVARCLEIQKDQSASFAGFLYHYYYWDSKEEKFRPKSGVEVSTIDTSLLLAGMITAGEYFADLGYPEIKRKVIQFYSNINWRKFYDKSRGLFRMAWRNGRFFGWWDFYTDEILLIALLASSSPSAENSVPLEKAMQGWQVREGEYQGLRYVYSWYGSLFTYLYAHAFIDFKRLGQDIFYGIDWWQNSRNAVLADINWCKQNNYPQDIWGLSASWSRREPNSQQMEYRWRIGAALAGAWDRIDNDKNGVKPVAPYAAISSIIFFPDMPLEENPSFKFLRKTYPKIVNHNGLLIESLDATKVDEKGIPEVNSNYVVGIDVVFPTLMIENYLSGLIWDNFMKNFFIRISLYRAFPESYASLFTSR